MKRSDFWDVLKIGKLFFSGVLPTKRSLNSRLNLGYLKGPRWEAPTVLT
jgi:hypothetical protein